MLIQKKYHKIVCFFTQYPYIDVIKLPDTRDLFFKKMSMDYQKSKGLSL